MVTATLADRLRAARSRTFVGRAAEVALFRRALADDPAPFSLMWVHGPGGIGKTALLYRLADEARASDRGAVFVDAATLDPTPEALARAVPDVRATGGRMVLLIDGVERLAPIDGWLRQEFLPGLPADSIVVTAGRRPPDARWRSDLGWSEQLRVVGLRDLEPADAEDYLRRRGVPPEETGEILRRTHGHPLALALLTDVRDQRPHPGPPGGLSGRPGGTGRADRLAASGQDVVGTLLERFLDDVPDPRHRRALQVLGHARVTTQGLLRAVGDPEHAQECFDWLRGLSFVEPSREGLAPHELARAVLDDDLRWRDPGSWSDLRRRVREFYLSRIVGATGAEQARATADLLWFHRDSPALAPYASWDSAFALWSSPARPGDLPAVLDLVAEHEDPASVALHRAWWERQPEAFQVIRSEPGSVDGFFVQLRLPAGPGESGRATAEQAGDPVALAAWDLVAGQAPLRPGEHLRVLRSWIGRDGYHRPTPTHQVLTGVVTRTWLTEPGLAVAVAYASGPELWTPLFAYVDYDRAPAGDVTVAGHRFAAYLHDWRVTTPAAWLELMAEREDGRAASGREQAAGAGERRAPALLVLSEQDVARAVRDAFRAANRPAELAANPLLRSRLMGGRPAVGQPGDAAAALRELLVAEVAALRADGRRALAARVLEVTYLSSARTQEAAAARLSLPFSTYRRHLAAGLAAVSAALWARELAGGG